MDVTTRNIAGITVARQRMGDGSVRLTLDGEHFHTISAKTLREWVDVRDVSGQDVDEPRSRQWAQAQIRQERKSGNPRRHYIKRLHRYLRTGTLDEPRPEEVMEMERCLIRVVEVRLVLEYASELTGAPIDRKVQLEAG